MLLEYQRIANISTDFHFEKFSVAALLRELLKNTVVFHPEKFIRHYFR